jgi:hypothetical protein
MIGIALWQFVRGDVRTISAEAEAAVLDQWAEVHVAVLGYPPNW